MYAINNREPYIDNKTISIHHSKHCADQLTEGREGEDAVNEVEIGLLSVQKYTVDELDDTFYLISLVGHSREFQCRTDLYLLSCV